MPEIHVYEPTRCCNTGVCGPELDERLVVFTADLAHVNEAGGQVQRHNLSATGCCSPESSAASPSSSRGCC